MRSNILDLCIHALRYYEDQNESITEYVEKFTKLSKLLNLSENDHNFVVEVLAGCEQYSKVLKPVLNGYMQQGSSACGMDFHLYSILLYLMIFRFDEIKISTFEKLIKNQNLLKVYRFLKFFLDEDNITAWIKEKWSEYYDVSYVEEELMKPLLRHEKELGEFMKKLDGIINHKQFTKLYRKPLTEIQPFNLTKPKPITVSLPDIASRSPTPKPKRFSMSYIQKEPLTSLALQDVKSQNYKRAVMEQQRAGNKTFHCARSAMSDKTKEKLLKLKQEEDDKLMFNMKHAKEIPADVTRPKPIKMTATAVLREAALYVQQRKQEVKRIDDLVGGGGDFSQMINPKSEEQKDQQSNDIPKNLLQSKIDHEGAMLVKQFRIKENRDKVRQFNEEKKEMFNESKKLEELETARVRKVVEDTQNSRENMRKMKRKDRRKKRKLARQINQVTSKLLEESRDLEAMKVQARSTLLKKLHAIENASEKTRQSFDKTTPSKQKEMFEMSYVEMRERFCLMKERWEKQREEKRDLIAEEKRKKSEAIVAAAAMIQAQRNMKNKMAKQTETNKTAFEEKMMEQKVNTDNQLNALRKKLKAIRVQRLKLTEELRHKTDPRKVFDAKKLMRDHEENERQRWNNMEKRANRNGRAGIHTQYAS